MTLQQQAYGLIDRLPDDSVQVIIQVMKCMLPDKETEESAGVGTESDISPKMKAYLQMKELRSVTAKYDISKAQRDEVLDEKFGTFG